MPNSFKFNSSTTESLSLRKGNIYIGVGDVGKGPTSLTGFKGSPSFGTASTLIGLHRGDGVFSWYRNFSDSELISRTNRIDPTGTNLMTSNPTPTTDTTGYSAQGGGGTLTFNTEEAAIRWVRTSYAAWGAYLFNNSLSGQTLDTFSLYTATFEWKEGPSHSATSSTPTFQINRGDGGYNVVGVNLLSNSVLQGDGWYRFTITRIPLRDGAGETLQYRIVTGNMAGITDIFWRKLEYYKTTRTTKEQCFSYFAGQSDKIVLNREYESIVTDGLVLNLDAGFLPSYPATGSSWQDLSGQGNNGTLQNGPTFDSGGWINFDGSNDFVQLSNTITLTSEFTLNLFILPTSTSTRVLLGNDGSDYLQINNSTALGLFSSTESITLNEYSWDTSVTSMVTVTRNTSNNIQTYKNGISSVSGTLTGNFRIKQIGQRGDSSRFYMGNIYKIEIYNRALSASEILQNYNATKGRFGL